MNHNITGNIPSQPSQAVEMSAPENLVILSEFERNQQTLDSESFFVNEAGTHFANEHSALRNWEYTGSPVYDLKNPRDAADYLIDIHSRELPIFKGDFDRRTLSPLYEALRKEKRAAIYQPENDEDDYEHENVAVHSFAVSIAATAIASRERQDLDLGKVSLMAQYHDLIVEAYGGDTPINDVKALATKEHREMASLTLFLDQYGEGPIADIMKEYEEGRTSEARFVKGVDKACAALQILSEKAILHKVRGEQYGDVVRGALTRASVDPTAFDLMRDIMLEMGRKWDTWECIPFEGDHIDIVDEIVTEIGFASADILALRQATPEGMPMPEDLPTAIVMNFPFRAVEAERKKQILDKVVLDDDEVRARGAIPLPRHYDHEPTPPATPQAMRAFELEIAI